MSDLFLGIDVGSTTVKVVVLDGSGTLRGSRYLRSSGQSQHTLLQALRDLAQEFALARVVGVGLTGSGGERIARAIGGQHVNELIAQTRAVSEHYPQARTVIEIGGQDSKFLALEWDEGQGKLALRDFAMNAICAAGTGSFLDQQAERLGIAIEGEFGALALQSESPARIAGRCTVFAKSDMIHLQQKGTPLTDILAGLCLALARNFKGVISKSKAFVAPVLFQGGVAYNQGVVRAFETVLGLAPGELIIPAQHHLMAAIGTALLAQEAAADGSLPTFRGLEALEVLAHEEQSNHRPLPALSSCAFALPVYDTSLARAAKRPARGEKAPLSVYLGVDVGSISTNLALIDEHGHVIARRYLSTAGKPLEAVREGLRAIGAEVGATVTVRGVGTTGSGRYLTADFVGGDVVRNEITAQARAATAVDPAVETIFEIGGQDSKYISLHHGAVVDFTMNSACAAGTGSFLEEQAERLALDIKADFSQLALGAHQPTGLGERCTVFMESDVIHHQQQGAGLDQLTAGLAYAIAQNYLNRVVNNRPIGRKVFLQGGVAWNQSVVAAFQTLLERQIVVPPHHDVTGAIGVAILAMEELAQRRAAGEEAATRFRGFDLSDRHYETTTFECRACPNICDVSKVVIAGEAPIFYGARCDKFEELGQQQAKLRQLSSIPDLFAERSALLLGDYAPPEGPRTGRPRLALARAMTFHDLFPYWRTLFKALEIELVLSEPTNPEIIKATLEHAGVESCLPAKLVHGHVLNLVDKQVDAILLPSMINREDGGPGQHDSNYCPFVSASAYLVPQQLDSATRRGQRLISLPFRLRSETIRRQELRGLTEQLGLAISSERIAEADAEAFAALQAFNEAIRRRGQEILAGLDGQQPAAVLIGRPYNTADLGVCQDLPYKLRKLGVLPIPIDFLPTNTVDIAPYYSKISSPSGQAILAAGLLVRDNPRLQAIYVTNFCCGPDAFFLGFFRRILGDKPFLELELDEHSADAGIVTRCEAFFDSLRIGREALV
ncbi:MAG: ATPase [Chloroflexales bacterium]|nr:ATPase [Chloroflexales bacterium]